MKNKSLIFIILIIVLGINSFAQVTGTFTDPRDKKTYKTVKIGTQTWMAQNLAYKTSTGCWSYNNDQSIVALYGYLYDWNTAKTVCPSGWHLPSTDEWIILANYLGGATVAGGKLKEKGTTHWQSPNVGATNETGFTGIPGGYRYGKDGTFYNFSEYGHWWSSSLRAPGDVSAGVFYWTLRTKDTELSKSLLNDYSAAAVRCVKD